MKGMSMRAIGVAAWFVVVLALAGTPLGAQRPADPQTLPVFAQSLGLREVAGFVETVQSLRTAKNLPPRYVSKSEARAHGWRGGGLCALWPGHVIGGDVMRNFGGAIPDAPGRIYREADLDSDCRSRGAKRLVFSNDGRIYVTVDHYNSFVPVP
jgi:hypothetical protein